MYDNHIRKNDHRYIDYDKDPNYEVVALHNYLIEKTEPSKFIPEKTSTKTVGMYCPRCRYELKPTDHGEETDCPGCGLNIITYGNGLIMSDPLSNLAKQAVVKTAQKTKNLFNRLANMIYESY